MVTCAIFNINGYVTLWGTKARRLMILTIDIGNTQIFAGVFDGDAIKARFRKTSIGSITSDELGIFLTAILREHEINPREITDISISSVVPSLLRTVTNCCAKYFGIKPFIVEAGIKTGIKIPASYDKLGADRVADCMAAVKRFPNQNLIVVDFGTANTFDAISKNKEYKEILHKDTCDGKKDNPQFDILLSNPPYSVSAFRQTTRDYYTNKDFDLYDSLTDNSSEIECLFVERAKQLLKDGGMAGIILPSSILNNTGIYTKTREMILRYFDIVAVAELGSNTFMATNTNTVALFLRRRDNYSANNIRASVENCFRTLNDVTINGIEKPMARYATHVWENIAYTDYLTLLQRNPNEKITTHEIYLDYQKKYPAKTKEAFMETVLTTEAEKLLYFILTYPQQMVVVKSGEKNEEKQFLGYEFSNRRGNEGIHAIQRGKDIDECTKLFDAQNYDNPEKASTYIYRAFKGDFTSPISESMKKHVFRMRLTDMIAFDRVPFEKNISLSIKKKVLIKSNWQYVKIGTIANVESGNSAPQDKTLFENGIYPFFRTSDIAKFHLSNNLTKTKDYLNTLGIIASFKKLLIVRLRRV